MSSDDEEKPPAPPLRLTSNRGSEAVSLPVDMRPLPKEPEIETTTSKSSFWLGGGSKKPKEEKIEIEDSAPIADYEESKEEEKDETPVNQAFAMSCGTEMPQFRKSPLQSPDQSTG